MITGELSCLPPPLPQISCPRLIDLLLSKPIETIDVWASALALVLYMIAECGKMEFGCLSRTI